MRCRIRLALAGLAATALAAACNGDPRPGKESRMTSPPSGQNRLALEKSPYLLQHADNPVDWYPWGDEAFERARREDRPVFLSIGYSTCHWCHVMEHESFEDPGIARLMNDAFVCVKVDREERPDVDHVYMTVCQMMTGSGGWPLTILLTPDRRPFFAATYIPKEAMRTFVPRVMEAWRERRATLTQDAERISDVLAGAAARDVGAEPGEDVVRKAFHELGARFDSTYGGFGGRPKFPTPHNLLFLLRYWKRTGDAFALGMVETTLERMRRGGVYDHVGFGFHRYSTDARWLVPHFEKMLYDQALMTLACVDAYRATGNEAYANTAREIAAYVMRDLSAPEGGFYSAEDADSEGEEGKFYVWSRAELDALLGAEAGLAAAVFGVEDDGNFVDEASGERPGTNILYHPRALDEVARVSKLAPEELQKRLEKIRATLFDARARRVRPHLDDKVLADWNGLMIAALASAGRALGDDALLERAVRAADFVLERMTDADGRLLHRYREGDAAIPGLLEDYAFMTWGLIELYEATFDPRHLERALDLARRVETDFATGDGAFYMTARDAEKLLVRPVEVYDGAVPSGNSVAMMNLARLARLTGDMRHDERARAVSRAFAGQVASAPMAHAHLLSAVDFVRGPSLEVVIAGRAGAPDVLAMQRVVARQHLPHAVTVFRPDPGGEAVAALVPYVKDQRAVGGAATAYVCRNFACELPVTRVEDLEKLLSGSPRP